MMGSEILSDFPDKMRTFGTVDSILFRSLYVLNLFVVTTFF